jgi:hypothetical protein
MDLSLREKFRTWSGKNKEHSRQEKVAIIKRFLSNKELSDPLCFSLPGTRALFEELLLQEKITTPERILCIQSPNVLRTHRGTDVLDILLPKLRELGSLPLFIGDVHSFPDTYIGNKTNIKKMEEIFGVPAENKFSQWSDAHPDQRIDIVDMDLCCQFNRRLVSTMNKFYSNNILSDSGLIFINHMKGRENTNAKMLILGNRDKYEKHFDVIKTFPFGTQMRILDIPLVYIVNAATYGYKLEIIKVLEYSDGIVHMMQYAFSFEKKEKVEIENKDIEKLMSIYTLANSGSVSTPDLFEKRCSL